MKKLLAIILTLILILTFTSCASDKQMKGEKTKTDNGIKYENHYAKIGYDFDESWKVYNDVEIKSRLSLDSDFKDTNGIFYDILAKKKTGTTATLSIVFFKVNPFFSTHADLETAWKSLELDVIYVYQNAGYKNIITKNEKIEFLGEETDVLNVYAEYGSTKYYGTHLFVRCPYHFAQIELITVGADETQEILSNFYALN